MHVASGHQFLARAPPYHTRLTANQYQTQNHKQRIPAAYQHQTPGRAHQFPVFDRHAPSSVLAPVANPGVSPGAVAYPGRADSGFILQGAAQQPGSALRTFLSPTGTPVNTLIDSSPSPVAATAVCRRQQQQQQQQQALGKCNANIERYLSSAAAAEEMLHEGPQSPSSAAVSYQHRVMASFQRTAHRLAELGLLDPRNRVQLAALSLYHHHHQQQQNHMHQQQQQQHQQHPHHHLNASAMQFMPPLFTLNDLDMALYGYTKSRGSPPCELSLSGLRFNELSYSMDRILSGCVQTTTKYSSVSRPDPSIVELPEGLVLKDESFGGVLHYGVFCGPKTYVMPRTRYGPFPGKQVNTSEIKTNDDNSFMWEIFKDGRLSHFVDGRGPTGNWMSYVNCARHPREQNLAAIQVDGQIYYEVCRELGPGSELLVWYDTECYVLFMGIPISMRDIMTSSSCAVGSVPDSDVKRATNVSDDCETSAGYQCERCGKVFAYQYYRDKHLKYTRCVDQGDRKFPCHLCTRSFEKRDRLRIHILHVHEKHRPHKCVVCSKSFSQSSSLNKHMRVHSGERPYKCVYCSKAFTASSILRTHIRQHSGEKPFKCKHCGKPFASHAAHDSHVRRTHAKMTSSFSCGICNRTFAQSLDLEFHLHSHDGGALSFSEDSYSPRNLDMNENCDETIDVVGGEELAGHR